MRLFLSFLACLTALAAFPLAGQANFLGPPPPTLFGLYQKSDLIVLARVGAAQGWHMEKYRPGSDFEVCARRVSLDAEQILKGLPASRLLIRETKWYCDEDDIDRGIPKAGTLMENSGRRLFFLRKQARKNGIYNELFPLSNGISSGYNVDKYVVRLVELDGIERSGEQVKQKTVEWLVSLTEDPETMIEGATEMDRAFVSIALENFLGKGSCTGLRWDITCDADFARLLTSEQKERLIQVFLQVGFGYDIYRIESGTPQVSILSPAQARLAGLVGNFPDARVRNRLIEQLPNLSHIFSLDTFPILAALGNNFSDKELTLLLEKFVSAEDQHSDEIITDVKLACDLDGVPDDKIAAMAFPPKTSGERKAELMERILARCKELMDGSP